MSRLRCPDWCAGGHRCGRDRRHRLAHHTQDATTVSTRSTTTPIAATTNIASSPTSGKTSTLISVDLYTTRAHAVSPRTFRTDAPSLIAQSEAAR